ncbi:hypothetical protein E2562_005304 [Oryza meyeriana var. granulata]|uniref:Uncharacterized protein n=1 Tax=Oryza meyeriana var. granulata TaxID=110450 RepID=A0A6G1EE08_9ORYZ|nr:hypothetical protein E2562_005304 [Oryza meyeriana var. granulata]
MGRHEEEWTSQRSVAEIGAGACPGPVVSSAASVCSKGKGRVCLGEGTDVGVPVLLRHDGPSAARGSWLGWHDSWRWHGVALQIALWAFADDDGVARRRFPWTGERTGEPPGLVGKMTMRARVSGWPPDRTVADRWEPSKVAI